MGRAGICLPTNETLSHLFSYTSVRDQTHAGREFQAASLPLHTCRGCCGTDKAVTWLVSRWLQNPSETHCNRLGGSSRGNSRYRLLIYFIVNV